MIRQFLIAGLPRCRTAWLSVASTGARSLCHHEPTPDTDSFESLQALWAPAFGNMVGISDSALTLQLERIIEVIKPRVLLVERPIEDVIASFRKYLAGTPHLVDAAVGRDYLETLQREIDRFRDHPLVRTITFDQLASYQTVRGLLEWLVPGEEFPDLPALMHMNIQVDRDYCLERANQPHNGWHRRPWNTSPKYDLT